MISAFDPDETMPTLTKYSLASNTKPETTRFEYHPQAMDFADHGVCHDSDTIHLEIRIDKPSKILSIQGLAAHELKRVWLDSAAILGDVIHDIIRLILLLLCVALLVEGIWNQPTNSLLLVSLIWATYWNVKQIIGFAYTYIKAPFNRIPFLAASGFIIIELLTIIVPAFRNWI